MRPHKELDAEQREELLDILQVRFEENRQRHAAITWAQVSERLRADANTLWSVNEMERTGGEPDIVCFGSGSDGFGFVDCSAESPVGRRNVCFDEAARAARKKNKPQASAAGMAEDMGIALLSEDQYRMMQAREPFDLKTSSWIATPQAMRELGGALFCDRRYNQVFTYHNGVESYYGARGFRGFLAL